MVLNRAESYAEASCPGPSRAAYPSWAWNWQAQVWGTGQYSPSCPSPDP